jgi:xylitol oxidase
MVASFLAAASTRTADACGSNALLFNWSACVAFACCELATPKTLDEAAAIIKRARHRLRVVGTAHSFSRVADTDGVLLSLRGMPNAVHVLRDERTGTATARCSANITYAELCSQLHAEGVALPSMASLPHISVMGAVATATHGSGDGNGCLSTHVLEAHYLDGDGQRRSCGRSHDEFQLLLLGCLGVVVELTLEVEPRPYEVRQDIYLGLPWEVVDARFDELMGSAYSVSLFSRWDEVGGVEQLWRKQRVPAGGELEPAPQSLFGARLADGPTHPLSGVDASCCTAQGAPTGPWHERLPHFRAERDPSAQGDELQSEYFVARAHAVAALRALRALEVQSRGQLGRLLLVSEVRSVAADTLWMSPFGASASVGLHFTWRHDVAGVTAFLPVLEAALAPLDARPHWGKLFTMAPARVRALYPALPRYRELAMRVDPRGKFRGHGTFVDEVVFAP